MTITKHRGMPDVVSRIAALERRAGQIAEAIAALFRDRASLLAFRAEVERVAELWEDAETEQTRAAAHHLRVVLAAHPVVSVTAPAAVRCPECRDGKHRACAGIALDADDEIVQCECPCDDGLTAQGGETDGR